MNDDYTYVNLRMTTQRLEVIIKAMELARAADNAMPPKPGIKLTQEQRNERVDTIISDLKASLILAKAAAA